MSKIFCCECKNNCLGIAVLASVVIAVVSLILALTGVFVITVPFLFIAIGIAIAYLAVLLVTSGILARENVRDCLCEIISVLLVAILGTIIVAAALLVFGIVATSIIGAILTGALAGLFTLIITTTACFVRCAVGCSGN